MAPRISGRRATSSSCHPGSAATRPITRCRKPRSPGPSGRFCGPSDPS
jgi:hypothetical protein